MDFKFLFDDSENENLWIASLKYRFTSSES